MFLPISGFLCEGKKACAVLGTNCSGKSLYAAELFQISEVPFALVSLALDCGGICSVPCHRADFLHVKAFNFS